MRGLDGRCIVVTGGASGIGRAIANGSLRKAHRSACGTSTPQRPRRAASEIRTSGGKATPYAVDITDHDGVREARSRNSNSRSAPSRDW